MRKFAIRRDRSQGSDYHPKNIIKLILQAKALRQWPRSLELLYSSPLLDFFLTTKFSCFTCQSSLHRSLRLDTKPFIHFGLNLTYMMRLGDPWDVCNISLLGLWVSKGVQNQKGCKGDCELVLYPGFILEIVVLAYFLQTSKGWIWNHLS